MISGYGCCTLSAPAVCVSGCCQGIVLAVWPCSVCRAEGPPGLLPGPGTQVVRVLSTSCQTGKLLLLWANTLLFPFVRHLTSWICSLQGFKVGYIVFQRSSSLTAAKSHPHNVPMVVCTEQRPVRTGVQSKWRGSEQKCIQFCGSFKHEFNVGILV